MVRSRHGLQCTLPPCPSVPWSWRQPRHGAPSCSAAQASSSPCMRSTATSAGCPAAEQLRGRDLASPPPLILAADTTVWFGAEQEPLQKPVDRAHATAMLRQLTGGEPHRVTTACAFARPDHDPPLLAEFAVTTVVRMRTLDERQFAAFIGPYLDAGDWTDKAGGYAIQGRAAGLV